MKILNWGSLFTGTEYTSTFHGLDIIPYLLKYLSNYCHIFFVFRKSQTWASVLEAARDNVIYVAAFTAQLENPATLPEHLKLAKDKQDATRFVLYPTAATPTEQKGFVLCRISRQVVLCWALEHLFIDVCLLTPITFYIYFFLPSWLRK